MAVKFLKVYLVFWVCAAALNLPMELIFTPEKFDATGIMVFYGLFSIPGALIFFKKNYQPRRMGILSFITGFVMEFALLFNADWVRNIYALKIGGAVIVAVVISAFYWFVAWGAPSYVIHKWFPGWR
jgi:hypothetical protein